MIKYTEKKDCFHYVNGKCRILSLTTTGKLNCVLCKCTFYETEEAYTERQTKFNERLAIEEKIAGVANKDTKGV